MRWLLIALILLLQAQPPTLAAAPSPAVPAMTSCHEAPAAPDAAVDEGDPAPHGAHDEKGARHMCPGCALPGVPPLSRPDAGLRPALPVAPPMASLVSLSLMPDVPPPRFA
ncbi:hypothetical protein [Alteraurantiacibacter palmitatis]|uniref:DUF2946 domain-containing protein n=1 Tax=Alteraurantiacibacter palmitatis TaxID=2054628 RepID=A0ABV7E5H0_9SPHN